MSRMRFDFTPLLLFFPLGLSAVRKMCHPPPKLLKLNFSLRVPPASDASPVTTIKLGSSLRPKCHLMFCLLLCCSRPSAFRAMFSSEKAWSVAILAILATKSTKAARSLCNVIPIFPHHSSVVSIVAGCVYSIGVNTWPVSTICGHQLPAQCLIAFKQFY